MIRWVAGVLLVMALASCANETPEVNDQAKIVKPSVDHAEIADRVDYLSVRML